MQLAPRAATLSEVLFPQRTLARHAILVVAASAVMALSARIEISIPIGPVPITGQTFAVLLVGALLGPWLGATAAALYVGEGIARLPVYAGGASGWGVITGATGGYLLSYPLAAFVVGWLAQAGWDRRPATLALAMVGGEVVIYAVGLPWLGAWMENHKELLELESVSTQLVLEWGLIPFIPGDLAKLLLAAALVPSGWQALQAVQLGPRRVLGGEAAPAAANLAPAALVAALAMAVAAALPWEPGRIGLEGGDGWVVLAAGIAGAAGAALRLRSAIGVGVAQLWGFSAAALGGVVAFVNLVDISAGGKIELADISFGIVVAMVSALALLAFTGFDGAAAGQRTGGGP